MQRRNICTGGQNKPSEQHNWRSSSCNLFFHGACRPNPGTASIGFVIYSPNGPVMEEFKACLGSIPLTHNDAEYKALIAGLHHALKLGVTKIVAHGDNTIVCRQVNGACQVRNLRLKRYCTRVGELGAMFESFVVVEIPRQRNSVAHSLAVSGFDNTFVDKDEEATFDIVARCQDCDSARKYVMEQIPEGCHKLQYILDVLQYFLPESYSAIKELGHDVAHEMGVCFSCQTDPAGSGVNCLACLLAIY